MVASESCRMRFFTVHRFVEITVLVGSLAKLASELKASGVADSGFPVSRELHFRDSNPGSCTQRPPISFPVVKNGGWLISREIAVLEMRSFWCFIGFGRMMDPAKRVPADIGFER